MHIGGIIKNHMLCNRGKHQLVYFAGTERESVLLLVAHIRAKTENASFLIPE